MLPDLYIFAEGEHDVDFFKNVVKPYIEKKAQVQVRVQRWAKEKKQSINRVIKTIKERNDYYIFTTDINSSPCITEKKAKITSIYNEVDPSKIIIVIKKIEGWYLAGLDKNNANKLGVSDLQDTNGIGKGDFKRNMNGRYTVVKDFMQELLKCFDVTCAKTKNKSFDYAFKYIDTLIAPHVTKTS
jgi:hypothetical protein